jgi:hypothetical protein
MKQYSIEYNQNGGEYTGYVTVTCNSLKQIDAYTVEADGVKFKFDEAIVGVEDVTAEAGVA